MAALTWQSVDIPEEFGAVFPPGLRTLLESPGLMIAGGSVMALGRFLGTRNPVFLSQIADLDVFVLNDLGLAAMEAVLAHPDTRFIKGSPAGTIMVHNPVFSSAPLQFVFCGLGRSMVDVLRGFDADCVMAALAVTVTETGEALFRMATFPDTLTAWTTNVATIVNQRAFKYRRLFALRRKGFAVRIWSDTDKEYKSAEDRYKDLDVPLVDKLAAAIREGGVGRGAEHRYLSTAAANCARLLPQYPPVYDFQPALDRDVLNAAVTFGLHASIVERDLAASGEKSCPRQHPSTASFYSGALRDLHKAQAMLEREGTVMHGGPEYCARVLACVDAYYKTRAAIVQREGLAAAVKAAQDAVASVRTRGPDGVPRSVLVDAVVESLLRSGGPSFLLAVVKDGTVDSLVDATKAASSQ